MGKLPEGRVMFLDESLPAGVLENAETEALWDECVRQFGSEAYDEWERFRAQAMVPQ